MTAGGPVTANGPVTPGQNMLARNMLALCGGTIVTCLDPPEVTDADLVLAGDRVLAVGAAPPGAARRDATGTLIVPGAVCAHHHL